MESSYEIGYVRTSFRRFVGLSRRFLGIRTLVFSEFRHGVTTLYLVLRDKARFFGKFFLPKKIGKWAKSRSFWNYWKIWSINFSEFLEWKLILFPLLPHKSCIWEKSGSWHMSQNALSQSDYISNISGTIWWNNVIVTMLLQIHENQKFIKICLLGMVKNGRCHIILKLALLQNGVMDWTDFFACW